MRHDRELTLEAVRRAASTPRDVTADRALLVALLLGPSLLTIAVLWSGFEAKTAEIETMLAADRLCAGFCAQAAPAAPVD